MSIKNGIDVSYWQGVIDWNKAKADIDFAIVRLGYGQNTVDKQAQRNISELNRLNIPYGVYWFSYAYTVEMARNEAKSAVAYLKKLGANLAYPVYFDWEYDSRKTAERNGVNVNKALLCDMATAFCEEVKAAGYYPGIYANPDYVKNHFGEDIFKKYDLWLAHYTEKTSWKADIWQYSSKGKVAGIDGNVDMNRCYKDYPAIIVKAGGAGTAVKPEKAPEPETETYSLKQFIKDVQAACGAAVDGIAGAKTIGKTVTLSAKKNARHAAIKPVQKRLAALGYAEVGKADGIAGAKFTSAVAHFQLDHGCVVDGEITAGNKTWKKLLGMK